MRTMGMLGSYAAVATLAAVLVSPQSEAVRGEASLGMHSATQHTQRDPTLCARAITQLLHVGRTQAGFALGAQAALDRRILIDEISAMLAQGGEVWRALGAQERGRDTPHRDYAAGYAEGEAFAKESPAQAVDRINTAASTALGSAAKIAQWSACTAIIEQCGAAPHCAQAGGGGSHRGQIEA